MDFVLSGFDAYAYSGGVWQVTGSSARDYVDGLWAAAVHMTGLGGDDTLLGSDWDDTFDGGDGTGDCFQHNLTPENAPDTLSGVETETDPTAPCPWPLVPNERG